MKTTMDAGKFFSTNLRSVYACLKNGPATIDRIISIATQKGVSFSHPRKDVIRSLIILDIMGLINKTFSGSTHVFELSENNSLDPDNVHEISRGIKLALDAMESDWIEIDIGHFRGLLKDLSDDNFQFVMDLLAKKKKIRTENGKVVKNVTVY